MVSYRLIQSGKSQRREYYCLNRSNLFSSLPQGDFFQEQKKSYNYFFQESLPSLLELYFPIQLKDYNNQVKVEVLKYRELDDKYFRIEEPKISVEEAYQKKVTWNQRLFLKLLIQWECEKVQHEISNCYECPECKIIRTEKEIRKEWRDFIKSQKKTKNNEERKPKKRKCEHYEITTQNKKDQIPGLHLVDEQKIILENNLHDWVKNSFKIGKFTLTNEKKDQWEVKSNDSDLKIVFRILPNEEAPERLGIKFSYEQKKEIFFCPLPKMTERGNFIINGNNRVIVFQSVRAPNIYFYQESKTKMLYGEIIPFKGPWIRIYFDNLVSQTSNEKKLIIKLKFLNTKKSFDLTKIIAQVRFPASLYEKIDQLKEEVDKSELSKEVEKKLKADIKKLEKEAFKKKEVLLKTLLSDSEVIKSSLESEKNSVEETTTAPKFLFNEKNTYFLLGKLGRKKFNQRFNILKQISGQTLAQDLKDKQGKLIFPVGTVLEKDQVIIIKELIKENNLPWLTFENYQFYSFSVQSPKFPTKKINILGPVKEENQKVWFDWEDMIIALSYFLNLHEHGIGKFEKEEEEKDSLENQVIRRVGDLLYNIFNDNFGIFKQDLETKYVGSISQLEKSNPANPTKFPKIQKFSQALVTFFYSSTLAQLQNENNPLAEISHARKISALGIGGFSSSNVVLSARNINRSYYGRYCPVETPEGHKVGLIHSLALNAVVDEYGQVLASYYRVKQGKIIPEIVCLTSEEELDKYITHCSIKIDENNLIEEKMVWARHQGNFVLVPKEKINFIDSSFYNLNSVNSSSIPLFQHNDSTRMLMAANMQKQAVIPLRGEAPLIASGIEHYLLSNAPLTIKASSAGIVDYVDSEKIIINQQEYPIKQFQVSNTNSLLTSVPTVEKGETVQAGQIIACGNYQEGQELALGQNLRVAFMCWKGYNFEDAIVINERLVKEKKLTSLFAKKYVITRKKIKIDEKVKEEELYPRKEINHLNQEGVVKLGSEVGEKSILVSKRIPCKQKEEELFLTSISGEEYYSFKDSSFYLPRGEKTGIVYKVDHWKTIEWYKHKLVELEDQLKVKVKKENQEEIQKTKTEIKKMKQELSQRENQNKSSYEDDDLEIIEVYVAQKRDIEVGDKLTTRFGNKGIVGKIVPEIDMPFDEEGKTVDVILNPLSVPSRMNIGQLVESFLGLIAYKLKTKLLFRPFNILDWEKIAQIAQENGLQDAGLIQLYDGQTGLAFEKKISVGYIYFTKLNHMVVDKIHVRNAGPYAMIHQQPLKGRSRGGGQKAGEMELWALEAHGAAYNLLEMTGIKSDDLYLRKLIQHSLIFGKRELTVKNTQSESFNLLLQYLRGIGFNLTALNYQNKKIDFYKKFSRI